MTADVDLLPLPSVLLNWPHPTNHAAIRDYARANVAHATAPLQAEIEALRAEVVKLRNLRADAIHECALANVRAERLAEALREMREYVTAALQAEREAFAGHEDCSDIPGIEADLHKIDAMLREQEEGA